MRSLRRANVKPTERKRRIKMPDFLHQEKEEYDLYKKEHPRDAVAEALERVWRNGYNEGWNACMEVFNRLLEGVTIHSDTKLAAWAKSDPNPDEDEPRMTLVRI